MDYITLTLDEWAGLSVLAGPLTASQAADLEYIREKIDDVPEPTTPTYNHPVD